MGGDSEYSPAKETQNRVLERTNHDKQGVTLTSPKRKLAPDLHQQQLEPRFSGRTSYQLRLKIMDANVEADPNRISLMVMADHLPDLNYRHIGWMLRAAVEQTWRSIGQHLADLGFPGQRPLTHLELTDISQVLMDLEEKVDNGEDILRAQTYLTSYLIGFMMARDLAYRAAVGQDPDLPFDMQEFVARPLRHGFVNGHDEEVARRHVVVNGHNIMMDEARDRGDAEGGRMEVD